MWSLGTWMFQAALCCVLLQTVLPSARGRTQDCLLLSTNHCLFLQRPLGCVWITHAELELLEKTLRSL